MEQRRVWDVARDLTNYPRIQPSLDFAQDQPNHPTIRPAQPEEAGDLLEFFRREFPNRWRFEFEEFLRTRGRISDYQLLIAGSHIAGFARLTFEDSERPIERFFMHRLPHPWGQLGPIGLTTAVRGKGLGSALLDVSLRHLRDKGVRGCVIDWTALVEFYGKFGFTPLREYSMLAKELGEK